MIIIIYFFKTTGIPHHNTSAWIILTSFPLNMNMVIDQKWFIPLSREDYQNGQMERIDWAQATSKSADFNDGIT